MLVQQKTYDRNVNHLVGIIPACGQSNDMFYPYHNCLLPIGRNISAIEQSIYECMLVGCQSIWINCHPSVVNVLKLYFGNYFKNPNFLRKNRFTNFPIVPKYLPIYYMTPNHYDFNRRTSWSYSALYAAKTANIILSKLFETTNNVKYYFSFPTSVYFLPKHKDLVKTIREADNFCFSYNSETFKDGLYASFTLSKKQIYDALDKISYMEGEYNDFGFNSRFFPISKVFKHLNTDNFVKIELDSYYPIYTNKKYFDYLKNGDYSEIRKRHKLIKNYMNWSIKNYDRSED